MAESHNIGRRGAIGLIGAGIAAAPVAAAAKPKTKRAPLDLTTPGDRLKAYMLMRGALDDRVVIGCISGLYYGVLDAELTPLYGVIAATFARYRLRADGTYVGVTMEQAYFTDLATGKVLTTFRNPVTGETVDVPVTSSLPAEIAILSDLSLKPARLYPGFSFHDEVLPIEARGDDVWLTQVSRTAAAPRDGGKPFRYSEAVVLHARRSELEAEGAKRVTCETTFNGVVNWRPWLKMGDRPGHLMAVGAGRYGAEMDELPAEWLVATRAKRPEMIADPAALLAPVWDKLAGA